MEIWEGIKGIRIEFEKSLEIEVEMVMMEDFMEGIEGRIERMIKG